MHAQIKSYGYFLLFTAVTALLVAPVVKSLNIPLLDKAVGN